MGKIKQLSEEYYKVLVDGKPAGRIERLYGCWGYVTVGTDGVASYNKEVCALDADVNVIMDEVRYTHAGYDAVTFKCCERDITYIAQRIHAVVKEAFGAEPYTGGCTTFYSRQEWADRKETYGANALFAVVYDGGDYAMFFEYDGGAYELVDLMEKELAKLGCYTEACTNWYSAVYRTRPYQVTDEEK